MTVVLTVAGVLLSIVIPRFSAARDRWAVRSAMSDLGASFSLARQTAIARRAPIAVVFDTAAGVIHVRGAAGPIRRTTLGMAYGVSIGSSRDSAVYDARGLGFGLSNLTVTVRRGTIVDTLTMSRLGRIRW
jgi:type II secretory pathway pseudopilin PulG